MERVDGDVADQGSCRAGLPRHLDRSGGLVGFDAMGSGDVGQPAETGGTMDDHPRSANLPTLEAVRMVVRL